MLKLLTVLLVLAGYAACTQQCPHGFKYDQSTNACFHSNKQFLSWNDADSYCKSRNATLVMVRNAIFNLVMNEFVEYGDEHARWWLGGKRTGGNTWRWEDGSPLNYTKWMPLQPTPASNLNCMDLWMINTQYAGWANDDCDERKPSVCVIENWQVLPTIDYGDCPADHYKNNGVIKSPGFPEKYPNNARCQYHLEVPFGQRVNVTVDEFQTEACCDWLYIHDGPTTDSPKIYSLRGKIAPGTSYASTGNKMTLLFISDESTNDKGFVLDFQGM